MQEATTRIYRITMSGATFTDKQLDYLYSQDNFYAFVNQYIADIVPAVSNSKLTVAEQWDDELKLSEAIVLARVAIANLEKLQEILVAIERNLSSAYSKSNRDIKGAINGRLRINEYIKRKSIQQTPKTYPCIVKERTFSTPENVALVFIVQRALNAVGEYRTVIQALSGSRRIGELQLLDEQEAFFRATLKKAYYSDCFEKVRELTRASRRNLPESFRREIELRLHKRQMPNAESYSRLWDWFKNFEISSLNFAKDSDLRSLAYGEAFHDKLFELWLLFRIMETLSLEYGLEILEINPLSKRLEKPIFVLESLKGNKISLYFQKGKGLFWDDTIKSKWFYEGDSQKPLRGTPDIVVEAEILNENLRRVMLIDAKNRYRSKGENSEEIYKMLGYFENFNSFLEQKYGSEHRFNCALVFRNDREAFCEKLASSEGDKILSLSLSPSDNASTNHDQMALLTRYILDTCDGEAGVAELSKRFKMAQRDALPAAGFSTDDADIEYEISAKTHEAFIHSFALADMNEKLEAANKSLKTNHYPHIWISICPEARHMLSMAECMYLELGASEQGDYAPLCLEYCRALETELNRFLISPFIQANQVLIHEGGKEYSVFKKGRDLTLGECVGILNVAKDGSGERDRAIVEYINGRIPNSIKFWNELEGMRQLNVSYRRKAAHTQIMTHSELDRCRERILGIGEANLFYSLHDMR